MAIPLPGEIANTEAGRASWVKTLAAQHLRTTFGYEGGPTGYGLQPAYQDAVSLVRGGGAIADPEEAGPLG